MMNYSVAPLLHSNLIGKHSSLLHQCVNSPKKFL
jgi:hypothetical protein